MLFSGSRSFALIIVTFALGLSLQATAASSSKKKSKKKNRETTQEQQQSQQGGDENRQGNSAAEEKDAKNSLFLPDWEAASFDFNLGPVVGFRAREHTDSTGLKTSSATAEAGAHLELKAVPIVPGNPGLQFTPHVGYAVGNNSERLSGGSLENALNRSSNFQRLWYGVDLIGYYKFYRHTLGLSQGSIKYDKYFSKIQSRDIRNDAGVLLFPHLSAHYTLDMMTVYRENISAPLSKENDNWLHTRLFTRTLNFSLDAGPGYTTTSIYNEISPTVTEKAKDYTTTYLLGLMHSDLFWKFYASARIKYLLSVDQSLSNILNNFIQLPTQGVNDNASHDVLPEDSIDASFFVGANRLIGPVGGGYYYTMLILNNKEKNGAKREVYNQQGYVVTVSFNF